VFFTRRQLPAPRVTEPTLPKPGDLDGWLDRHEVLDGSPFLLDPVGGYDVVLNRYFAVVLSTAQVDTQKAAAYDLVRFLTFLWDSRSGRSWRQATVDDRAAYKHWRLVDPRGPRVRPSTWDREVATVNQFYRWAVLRGLVVANPFVQRDSRSHRRQRLGGDGQVPAELSHQGPRHDLAWLPPVMYRRWRDVGVRGFGADGLPDASFRGRYASRNATFADLMIRTGLRLSEQTSMSLFELPDRVGGLGSARTWLPAAIAKCSSARSIYIPASVLADVWDYVELERAQAVEEARAKGRYQQIRDPLIVEDRRRPVVVIGGRRLGVDKLDGAERRRLLIRTENGLEPAALWLGESGLPSMPSGWQQVFKDANGRCARLGVRIRCNPHLLRHSFAVITLEQLWRGHIQELAGMVPAQRQTYQMVFGDPLNWVRMRLGHRSVQTTQIYLHTLQELEMHTRMALVPDGWEPTGFHPDDLDVRRVPSQGGPGEC
jgi:site-specific recombinase XerD